jgi:hypothetical protein
MIRLKCVARKLYKVALSYTEVNLSDPTRASTLRSFVRWHSRGTSSWSVTVVLCRLFVDRMVANLLPFARRAGHNYLN